MQHLTKGLLASVRRNLWIQPVERISQSAHQNHFPEPLSLGLLLAGRDIRAVQD